MARVTGYVRVRATGSSSHTATLGPDRVKTQPAAYIDRIVMLERAHEAIRRR